jgi:hypothetical protein
VWRVGVIRAGGATVGTGARSASDDVDLSLSGAYPVFLTTDIVGSYHGQGKQEVNDETRGVLFSGHLRRSCGVCG